MVLRLEQNIRTCYSLKYRPMNLIVTSVVLQVICLIMEVEYYSGIRIRS